MDALVVVRLLYHVAALLFGVERHLRIGLRSVVGGLRALLARGLRIAAHGFAALLGDVVVAFGLRDGGVVGGLGAGLDGITAIVRIRRPGSSSRVRDGFGFVGAGIRDVLRLVGLGLGHVGVHFAGGFCLVAGGQGHSQHGAGQQR